MGDSYRTNREDGVALILTLLAMSLITATISAAFYVGVAEERMSRSALRPLGALAAAESGLNVQVALWNRRRLLALPTNGRFYYGGPVPGFAGWYRGSVTRLNADLYLVRSEGFSSDSSARRHLGLLLRLRGPAWRPDAAVTSLAPVELETSGPSDPIVDPGCEMDSGAVWLEVPGLEMVSGSVCDSVTCAAPWLKVDSTLTGLSGRRVRLDSLRQAIEEKAWKLIPPGPYSTIQPVIESGSCATAVDTNLGEPVDSSSGCHWYAPVVVVRGDLELQGGRGQGILLVEGDLQVSGPLLFRGLVVVSGSLHMAGSGALMQGAVVAGFTPGALVRIAPGNQIQFSRCAFLKALRSLARPVRVAGRSWANLF